MARPSPPDQDQPETGPDRSDEPATVAVAVRVEDLPRLLRALADAGLMVRVQADLATGGEAVRAELLTRAEALDRIALAALAARTTGEPA